MNVRQRYTVFYQDLATPPLFHHPAWLDMLCGQEKWTALFYVDNKGRDQAVLPVTRPGKLHRLLLRQPPLTPWLGPLYTEGDHRSPQQQHAFELKVMRSLAKQMPRAALTMLHFAPHSGSWLPFYWAGFRQTIRYTYQIDLTASEESLWAAIARNQRQLIRRGQEQITIEENGPWLDDVYQGLQATLSRNNVPVPLRPAQWQEFSSWLVSGQRGRLYTAKAPDGQPLGHVFLVWDNRTAYFLISTAPEGRMNNNYTMPTLVWHVIRQAKKQGKAVFDFEGSMLEGVGRFFRSFGALPVPYHRITKTDLWFWRG